MIYWKSLLWKHKLEAKYKVTNRKKYLYFSYKLKTGFVILLTNRILYTVASTHWFSEYWISRKYWKYVLSSQKETSKQTKPDCHLLLSEGRISVGMVLISIEMNMMPDNEYMALDASRKNFREREGKKKKERERYRERKK